MSIGERIANLLKEQNKKESDLAKYLNTRQSTVQNWTRRGTNPSAEMIVPLCTFFGVTPNYLLTGHEVEPPKVEQLKDWVDTDGNKFIASDEQAELARLRINDALTKRVEEIVQEVLKDRESNKG